MPAATGVAVGRGVAPRYEAVASKDPNSPQQLPPNRSGRGGASAATVAPPHLSTVILANRDDAGSDVHGQADRRGEAASAASAAATAHEALSSAAAQVSAEIGQAVSAIYRPALPAGDVITASGDNRLGWIFGTTSGPAPGTLLHSP